MLVVIAVAGGRAQDDNWTVLREFANGAQGWGAASAAGTAVPAVTAFAGREGIVVPVAFPRPTLLTKERIGPGILGEVRQVQVDLFVPAGAAPGMELAFCARDKDGTWHAAACPGPFRADAWQTVTFDLTEGAGCMLPDGQFTPWDATAAANANGIGILLYGRRPFTGAIGFGTIRGRAGPAATVPLGLTAVTVPAAPVRVYGLYELAFRLTRDFADPFDPDTVAVDAVFGRPDGSTVKVPGFWYREYLREWDAAGGRERLTAVGPGLWKVRFTPLAPGPHTCTVTVRTGDASFTGDTHSFTVLPATAPGFVGVDRTDPRYFTMSDGSWFYPVGHNIRSPNDPRCANVLGIPVPPDRGTFAYDEFFARMAANGENLVEIWMCAWWVDLEWIDAWQGYHGLGVYNLANAWRLDHLLEQAARYGIFVHLVIDNHGKLSVNADPEWPLSPYNAQNGGPLNHPNEFFTNADARRYYDRKLRYILARWGWSPTIMGFELWSELDLVGQRIHTSPVVHAWHKATADMIHAYPVPRIVTTHYSGDYKAVDPVMAALPQIDYVVGDGYRGDGPFAALAQATGRRWRRFGKPGFITEFGGSWNGTTPARLRADLHSGIWSAFFTDMAGVPLFWWFDFIHREDLYPQFKAFRAFIAGEDKRGRDLKAMPVKIEGPAAGDLAAMALGDPAGGYLWLYGRAAMEEYTADPAARPLYKDIRLIVTVPAAGAWTAEIWDTGAGTSTALTPQVKATELTLDLPPFRADCALKLRLAGVLK
ncbi:MAG: DUF5060 domain-containing protein [Planctomycetota bacterium]